VSIDFKAGAVRMRLEISTVTVKILAGTVLFYCMKPLDIASECHIDKILLFLYKTVFRQKVVCFHLGLKSTVNRQIYMLIEEMFKERMLKTMKTCQM